MSTVKTNAIYPVTSGSSLTLKGNTGGSATGNGITVDTSGNSAVGGTLAVAGNVTLSADLIANDIKTESNSYKYAAGGELNSIGYLNHNFFGCSYYLSGTQAVASGPFDEVTGTWAKMPSSGATGSDDADPFGKFSGGRWTPTVSGYYLVCGSVGIPGLDDGENAYLEFRRNGLDSIGNYVGRATAASSSAGKTIHLNSGGIIQLNAANDYVSMWVSQDTGGDQNLGINQTQISTTFVGTSDL